VIEVNCLFGDPEAQAIIPRLKSDIVPLLEACADGNLNKVEDLEWDPRPAICVVAASAGYPASSSKGDVIEGLDAVREMEDVHVFHAGTARQGDDVVTAGGRVLGVTALGDDIEQARERAYDAMERIRFDGMQYRRDIASRALNR
jgi:phosphoribosylamine--glycine ligase